MATLEIDADEWVEFSRVASGGVVIEFGAGTDRRSIALALGLPLDAQASKMRAEIAELVGMRGQWTQRGEELSAMAARLSRECETSKRLLDEVTELRARILELHERLNDREAEDASAEAQRLRDAIHVHFTATVGHSMCWENDVELWRSVGITQAHGEPPPWPEFMEQCVRYRKSREGL